MLFNSEDEIKQTLRQQVKLIFIITNINFYWMLSKEQISLEHIILPLTHWE